MMMAVSRFSGTSCNRCASQSSAMAAVRQSGGVVVARHMQQSGLALCDAGLHRIEASARFDQFVGPRLHRSGVVT